MTAKIKSWSFSRWKDFEQCPLKAKLKYLDRVPEPERELPPGKTEHANDRGSRIHLGAELYVQGKGEMLIEMSKFTGEFMRLRELYAQGAVILEEEWAFNRDWQVVDWKSADAWLRLKCDVVVRTNPSTITIIDYKTGKKHSNEIKHAEQLQLYQLAAFLKFPEVDTVHVELWYLDVDDITSNSYTRKQGEKLLTKFTKAGLAVTEETDFEPKPNAFSCKWCPYGPKGTGHCQRGI